MPQISIQKSSPIVRTPRVMQLEGLFEVPPAERSNNQWSFSFELPETWNIGLIVGPSGSGKTTLARECFGNHIVSGFEWPNDKAIVDGFPAELGIKEIAGLLSSVGFSSPPSWLRPFGQLSNGEQFRVTLARALAESKKLTVIDEFTSVVDRTVAQIGSAAVAKAVRRLNRQFIALSCHYDILDWLDPDWVIEMPQGLFTRRMLRRRPEIELEIVRVHHSAWRLFQAHHYLDSNHSRAAKCFVALLNGRPVAFCSAIHAMGRVNCWREHRCVCLPDFQGVGIGNALSEFVASVMRSTGKPYTSTTSNPAMIRHRMRSPHWRLTRKASLARRDSSKCARGLAHRRSVNRLTAGFRFVGPADRDAARGFG